MNEIQVMEKTELEAVKKNSKKGFTLVELVVVIAILAIIAAIAIPVVNSIINTSSRNGGLSNAQTIELAVKEAQSAIAAQNTEVYDGVTTFSITDIDNTNATGTFPSAVTDHGNISMLTVAAAKGIPSAFSSVTYNGNTYLPMWDVANDACVYVCPSATINGATVTNAELSTEQAYAGDVTNLVQLTTSTMTSVGKIDTAVTVDNL